MIKDKEILYYAGVDLNIANACSLHVLGIVNGMANLGYKVTVILPKPTKEIHNPFFYNSPNLNYIFHYNPILRPRFLGALFAIWPIFKVLIKKRPQFFYLRMSFLSFILLLISRIMKVRTITEHNGWVQEEMKMLNVPSFFAYIGRLIQLFDCKLACKVLLVTEGLKNQLVRCGIPENKCMVVENGTDINQFKPIERIQALSFLELNPDYFYLGFIGALTKWQGLGLTLECLYKVSRQNDNIRLIIGGEGPERNNLEQKAKRLGIENKVYFLGSIPLKNANIVINCFDIALSNSTVELNNSIGVSKLKIRDYSSAGRAIIASGVPGNIELANQAILVIHTPDDLEDLVKHVLILLKQPELLKKYQEASRNYAKQHFSWEKKCLEILSNKDS
jgi:glycosyltransferase involved in cell wall biosynthesis